VTENLEAMRKDCKESVPSCFPGIDVALGCSILIG